MGTWTNSPTGEPRRKSDYAVAEIVDFEKRYTDVGDPWRLVEGQFITTGEYANTSFNNTLAYIADMQELLKELQTFDIPDIDIVAPEVPDLDYNARPKLGKLDLVVNFPPNTSEKPRLVSIPGITIPNIPTFSVAPPEIRLPSRPEESEIESPGSAPVLREVNVPIAPSLALPDAPVFSDIVIPGAPSIGIPAFDATLVEEQLGDPERLNWEESPFNSDIWDVLLEKARDGIVNGGTGLAVDVEFEIWRRALSRQQVENDKSYQEIETYFSSRGFTIPPGAMAGRLQEKDAEIQRNNQNLNSDITIKQAELAQTNTHFMLEFGRQAEVILRDFHNAQMDRGLEAAKAIALNSIEILNAYISRYNLKIEKYKADAAVFGERVRAALVEIEIFKGQVESAKVSVEVQKAMADLYGKQIAAIETVAKIYAIEMDGAKTETEIEGLRLKAFAERINAYVAEVTGDKLRYDAFNSAVQGEKITAELYSEQVNAYVAGVSAEKVKAEVQDISVRSASSVNISEIDRYKSELGAYSTEIDAEAKRIGGVVEGFKGEVGGYVAETQAESSRLGSLTAMIGMKIEEGKLNLQKAIAEIDSATKGYIAIKGLQVNGTDGVMGVSAQLAASAMNAVSATASYGYSGSESVGQSFNYGATFGETHSFSHPTRQLSD